MSLTKSEILASTAWEAELRRVNGALRVVGAANKALTVASDVAAWLNQVCRSAVEAGGYRMAWVGFAESDEEKIVRPVAHAGFDAGFLDSITITWKDEPRGAVRLELRSGPENTTSRAVSRTTPASIPAQGGPATRVQIVHSAASQRRRAYLRRSGPVCRRDRCVRAEGDRSSERVGERSGVRSGRGISNGRRTTIRCRSFGGKPTQTAECRADHAPGAMGT